MGFINGKKYYSWLAIYSEILFILAFQLTQAHDSGAAFILMKQVKSMGNPNHFITDRLSSYNKAFKVWYKYKKGFNPFEKANNLIYMFIFNYNFIRPHESLNDFTSSEVAGFNTNNSNKNNWFIVA
uniref:Transposase n=1 Tax=Clostridium perfringens TaxID=1502 RepID=A0A126G9J5_CLOPF|nr:transposase [Clostridium perfringens]